MRELVVDLSESGIKKLIQELDEYENWIEQKAGELAERLATMGATYASLEFSRAVYTGEKDYEIQVEQTDVATWVIKVNGESVLFIEFGTGITYGYGHPDPEIYGPGTYEPSKGHWDNPKGWWLPKEKGGTHTYGNPPNMCLYNTQKQLEQELTRIAEEVFTR